jgi:hypothetical protein
MVTGSGASITEPPHHHLWLYATRRHGCWGECQCGGWRSRTWTSSVGVELEFGRHLVTMKLKETT